VLDAPRQDTARVAFGGCAVLVTGCDGAVSRALRRRYWAMAASPADRVTETLVVSVDGSGYRCEATRQEPFGPCPLNRFLDELEYRIALALVDARPDLLWLHAGAAAWQGQALVFPAVVGNGKSTLTTRLCESGWQYLSDEYVPYDSATGTVSAFPRMPDVRIPSGTPLLEHSVRCMPKQWVKLSRTALAQAPAAVRALVLPQYRPASGTDLRRASPAEAAFEVLRNLMNARADDPRIIGGVRDLVSSHPAYRLAFHEADPAIQAVLRLAECGTA
jgi:hypothetical protein